MVTIMSSARAPRRLGLRFAALAATTVFSIGVAAAQEMPPQDSTFNGGAGIRTGHIASTGRTMPNPGVSQSAGPTPMDEGIRDADKQIESSVCKGC